MGLARLRDRLRTHRRVRHDVVFYMPGVGFNLSPTHSIPGGGAENQVLMLAAALAQERHRVAIIAYGEPRDLPSEVAGVTIVARPPYRRRPTLTGKLIEPFLIWRSLWLTPSRALVTRCAGIQVGLVALYARLARRRFVFASSSVGDFDPRKLLPERRDRVIYRLGIFLADAIVVQTETQVEECRIAFGRRPVLIKSIAAPAEPQSEEPLAFLWVGRLASYKRPMEYVELARAVPEARFWMVGVPVPHAAGAENVEDAVSAAAAEIPNLELLSPRSQSEIGKLMSRAVASVNTADFEGMPNVLLEAWGRGVPALVLAHDPSGVVASHGLGMFARGSRQALIDAARELWENRADRDELSRRCRAYVHRHHSPEVIAAQWRETLATDGAVGSVELSLLEASEMSCGHRDGDAPDGRYVADNVGAEK